MINLVAILLLAPKASRVVKDYFRQRASGLEPTFDPEQFPELDLDPRDWSSCESTIEQR